MAATCCSIVADPDEPDRKSSFLNLILVFFYRPQRSWAKVMFLQVCVILFTGRGCLPQCMLGYHTPLGADTPREQTPPQSRHPPGADTPTSRQQTPWEQAPPSREQTPRSRHPPEQTPPSKLRIRSTSGRYTSYLNAFHVFKF